MPTLFRSSAALLERWREFCHTIAAEGFSAAPTDTAFIRAVAAGCGCRDTAVSAALARYAPSVQAAMESIRADTLTQGALAGKYPASVSTFVLKNLCGWEDKPAPRAASADVAATAAEIERMMTGG